MLYTSVFVALLGASVINAAPASTSSKTAFSVNTIPKPNHQKDIHAAIQRLNMKYGKNSSIVHQKRQDGSAAASLVNGGSEYTVPVTVGGQTLNLDFDTGSSDLWMFSSLQPKSQTNGHKVFTSSKSSTYKATPGSTWSITFGDQSSSSGIVGTDTVNVGGSVVKGQSVELAKTVSAQFVQDDDTSGLLGLAYGSLNTISPAPQKTFFENLAPSLQSPIFAASLKQSEVGSYDFGYIDSAKYSGSLNYAPYDSSNGWYEFPTTSYTVSGQTFQFQNGQTGIADTGTTLLALSSDVVSNYHNAVQGATQGSDGSWSYPCSQTLPDFTFTLGNTPVTIPGSIMQFAQDGNTCYTGLYAKPDGITQDIYGDIFFKAYYVVFDVGNSQLGFAPHA